MGEKLTAHPEPDLLESYLANIRGTVPLGIEQIDAMLRLVAAARDQVRNFLDLSCEGGTMAAALLDEYPHVTGVLIENSAQRMDATRQRLGETGHRVTFLSARYASAAWSQQAAEFAPFDVVLAGAEIWPVSDERKREIFTEIHQLLTPGGLLLNLEHVASATRWTQSALEDQVIDAIFGEFIRAGKQKARTEIAREFYERVQDGHGPHAPLEVQCDWLREIGYENVECFLKVAELAVFGGQKAGGTLRTE